MPCDVCKKQKEYGHPRPSCEECGLVELSEDNTFVWLLYNEYFPALIEVNGFGGASINAEGLKMICEEYDITDRLELMERISILLSVLLLESKGDE